MGDCLVLEQGTHVTLVSLRERREDEEGEKESGDHSFAIHVQAFGKNEPRWLDQLHDWRRRCKQWVSSFFNFDNGSPFEQ